MSELQEDLTIMFGVQWCVPELKIITGPRPDWIDCQCLRCGDIIGEHNVHLVLSDGQKHCIKCVPETRNFRLVPPRWYIRQLLDLPREDDEQEEQDDVPDFNPGPTTEEK